MRFNTDSEYLPRVNLQLVGVQKAGTSALAHFLSQHPDICLVKGKEAHVFDQPEFADAFDKQAFANNRYMKKLSHYNGESIICDATPITIFNKSYMKACIEYNPNARFIVLLRDPVARAISHYKMMKSKGVEDRNMFMAFISESDRLKENKSDEFWPRDSAWRHFSYLKRGLYRHQLKNLYSLADEKNVLVLEQSELLLQHQATLKKVFKYLNLPTVDVPCERVFEGENELRTWSDMLGFIFATIYFKFRQ